MTFVVSKVRLKAVLTALESLAAGDLKTRLPITHDSDELDAFALAVNIIAAELAYTTVSRAHLSNVLEAISDVVLALDDAGRIHDANRAAQSALGLTLTALRSKTLADIFVHPEQATELRRRLKGEGSVRDFEASFLAGDGSALPMSINGAATVDEGRGEALLVLVARDLTVMRKLMDLTRAKEAAEEASRLKSAFLANVSHEIRTPMTAILGFAELLQAEGLSASTRARHTERLTRNGRLLLRLIDDILDLSQIESGKLDITVQKISPTELAQSVLAAVEPLAGAKNLPLSMTMDENLPASIGIDALRARQVLVNVVGNAVKFTKVGRVAITFSYRGAPGRGTLVVDCKDTGIGIAADRHARLFQPFSQTDPSVKAQYGGSGLGLAVARQMVRAIGGDLELIRSETDKGAHFRVSFSDRLADAYAGASTVLGVPAEAGVWSGRLAGVRILVAEDTPDTQTLLQVVLSRAGAIVTIVENGRQVVERAQAEVFDVLLMDIRMPVMDGAEAISVLRKGGYKGCVLALTAHAMRDDTQRYLAIGFDGVLTKPLSWATLLDTIERGLVR